MARNPRHNTEFLREKSFYRSLKFMIVWQKVGLVGNLITQIHFSDTIAMKCLSNHTVTADYRNAALG